MLRWLMFYEGNLVLILKGQEHRELNVTSRVRAKCHPSYLACEYLIPYPGKEKSVRKHWTAWPDADFWAEISQLSLKCQCPLCSVHSGWFMVLRVLFQMVLNFQIVNFTKFLQTSVLFECLVFPHYGHAEKPSPRPGCFEVSEWFCLRLDFDHADSVIPRLRDLDLRGASCQLAFEELFWNSQRWLLLAICAAGNILCELPQILIPD